jgi:DNA-binding NarL/FixJ family response regulator
MPLEDVLETTVNPRRSIGPRPDQGLSVGEAGSVEASYETWTRPLPFGPTLAARSAMTFSALWTQLATTSLRFSTTLDTRAGCVLVFRRGRENDPYTLSAREQQVLHRTLLGRAQKQIAAECNITPSTVSFSLRSVMMKLGFRTRLELVPFAALAAGRQNSSGFSIFSAHGGEVIFATAGRVDWSRFPEMTRGEREIGDLIVAGKSNQEIARARSTSVSTVHNQVTLLFRKLGVRDRFDLVRVLFAADAEAPTERSAFPVMLTSAAARKPN